MREGPPDLDCHDCRDPDYRSAHSACAATTSSPRLASGPPRFFGQTCAGRYSYRKRTGTPLSVWSQHGRLVAVKGLFRWLTKQRALAVNPAAELELPRVTAQRLPQPLTDAEITQVLAHADPTTPIGLRDRALLETGYSTGLRRMELIRLRLYDLDLARGVVVVREGKGQKDRVVPIGERAIAWLEKYLDEARPEFVAEPDGGTVFLGRRGRPFHPNHLSRLTRDYLVAAGIAKKGACHLLRHTMATGMLEHGADVRVIQEILGHARLTTTQLYTRVSIRLLKAVHSPRGDGAQPSARSTATAKVYRRRQHEVELRCETCHGTLDTLAAGVSAQGRKLRNLFVPSGANPTGLVTLLGKLSLERGFSRALRWTRPRRSSAIRGGRPG